MSITKLNDAQELNSPAEENVSVVDTDCTQTQEAGNTAVEVREEETKTEKNLQSNNNQL